MGSLRWVRSFLFLPILFAVSSAHPALSEEITSGVDEGELVPLTEVMSAAARVARVKLTSRTAIGWEGLNSAHPCGFVYEAKVIEPLVGGKDNFSFFSPVDEDFRGFDREYLVFAYERDPKDADKSLKLLAGALRYREYHELRCKTLSRYYVPFQPQLLRSFDPKASADFGGEWLDAPNRDSIVWCQSDDSLSRPNLVLKKKTAQDPVATLIEWNGLRRMIKATGGVSFFRRVLPSC